MQRLFALIVGLIVFFAVASTEARWGHGHLHHKGPSTKYPTCHFMGEKSTFDLRLFMRDLQGNDWEVTSSSANTAAPGSAFYFNPCSAVSRDPCPKDSALCQITPKGEAISFGNVTTVQWAEVDAGFQLTYDDGEMCNNGAARKTVVLFTCSEPNTELSTHITSLDDVVVDDCQVTITVTSMYGCATEQLCTVFNKPSCDHSEGLCEYNSKQDTCSMAAVECTRIGHHHLSHGAILGACVAAFSLLICVSGCCALVCRKRRQCRARRNGACRLARLSRRMKKAEAATPAPAPVKTVDEESVVPLEEQQQAVYIPMQQPVYVYQPQQGYYAPYAVGMPSELGGVTFAPMQQQHGIN